MATGLPSVTGPLLVRLEVGATFVMLTTVLDVAHALLVSHTRSTTGCTLGPSRSAAENVAFWPGVSNEPLLSRSQAKLRGSLFGSLPDPLSWTSRPPGRCTARPRWPLEAGWTEPM